MNVENLAVNRVSDRISKCPYLESYLDQNDRTPLTDGHIDIHASTTLHTKENFKGRVPVQIKGKSFDGKKKTPTKFQVDISDLKGFVKMSGVLYFVVFIEKKTMKREVKYAVLNTFKILAILKTVKPSQKTVGVVFKPFPKDPEKIQQILDFALQAQPESASLQVDAKFMANIKEFTLYTGGDLDLDTPLTLNHLEFDFSLVATTTGGMTLPINVDFSITPTSYFGEETDLTVSSGPHAFHNPIRRRIDGKTVEFELNEGLRVRSIDSKSGGVGSISVEARGTLEDHFQNIGFLLACHDNGSYIINDATVSFEAKSIDDDGEVDTRDLFEYLGKLREVLIYLGADPNLVEIDALIGKRGRQLANLYEILISKSEKLREFEEQGRVRQPLGQWNLELLIIKDVDSGDWTCRGMLDPDIGYQYAMETGGEDDEPEISRVTAYEILDDEFLPFTLNLRLDHLVDAYEDVSTYPNITDKANLTVLKLVTAADRVELRRHEFLSAASKLNDWLMGKDGETAIHLINRWQIISRSRVLRSDERRAIRDLKRKVGRGDIDAPAQIETACAILLGDQEDVEYCFGLLAEAEQDLMKGWPIWQLWRPGESIRVSLEG
jgi:hypothetical protein